MLRVFHVVASMSPEWGGPVTAVQALTSALVQRGIHCEIVTARGWRVGTAAASIPQVPIHRFETGLLARVWTAHSHGLARFLDQQVHRGRCDLIHVHEIWHYPGYAAFRVARRHGLPYVLSFRGALDKWRLRHKGIRKRIYRQAIQDHILQSADALHALTRAEMARISALGYTAPVFLAPNGVAPSQLQGHTDTADFRRRYPALDGKRIILFLGRMHAMKGLDVLARSFATVASRFADAVLLVAGPDEDGTRHKTEAILKAAGILDRVVFTGLLTGNDKRAAFACADLFVLSSYSEGFSNAVLEALAAGLPVVITEQCNFPEVSEHQAGLVVAAAPAPVADAISTLLADDACRIGMGQNGRKLVMQNYVWPAVAGSFSDLYRSLVENRRARE